MKSSVLMATLQPASPRSTAFFFEQASIGRRKRRRLPSDRDLHVALESRLVEARGIKRTVT